MGRCVHIYENGFQCIDDTLDPTPLCESHQKVVNFHTERFEESWLRKAILRFVAFILLVTLLVPLLYRLKNLYWGPRAEAREVW
jgi:hypothetical protein